MTRNKYLEQSIMSNDEFFRSTNKFFGTVECDKDLTYFMA